MAQKYLGVVVTLIPSKRLFSKVGNVITAKRSALEPEDIDKAVFPMIISHNLAFHVSKLSDINLLFKLTVIKGIYCMMCCKINLIKHISHVKVYCLGSLAEPVK